MYENFYKLKSSPFRLSPDPSFFFGSKGHNRALAYLRYGLQQKEGFIVITGTPGTGKTTIARTLLQEVKRDKVIVAELNTTHLNPEDVLRIVTGSFGLDFENTDKATLLKRLETYFIARYRAGYHILLIVDEAQNLPFESIEELRMLSNFYMGKSALIQIFLLGQEQFRESLYSQKLEQLRQRVVASCHLEPLNQQETREYIEYRLGLVGWKNDPQISDRAYARIYTVTRGVPRRINTFCDRLFLFGSLDDLHELKDIHVKDVATELMYEVSAKDVKLADIQPIDTEIDAISEVVSDPEIADSSIESETIDSLQLEDFSDDVPDIPDSIPESVVSLKQKSAEKQKQAQEASFVHKSEHQPIRVVTNSNVAVESLDPLSVAATAFDPDNKPDWWNLVAISVDYYTDPDFHDDVVGASNNLPGGVSSFLKFSAGNVEIPSNMLVDELLGVEEKTLKFACKNYIQNVLLSSKANYYRRMGVSENEGLDEIRTHYRYLFRLFQSDQSAEANEQDEIFLKRINQAFSTLRSVEKRKEYDDFLLTIKNKKPKPITAVDEIDRETMSSGVPDSLPEYYDKTDQGFDQGNQKRSNSLWLVLFVIFAISGLLYFAAPYYDDIKGKIESTIADNISEDVISPPLVEGSSSDDFLINTPQNQETRIDIVTKENVERDFEELGDVNVSLEERFVVTPIIEDVKNGELQSGDTLSELNQTPEILPVEKPPKIVKKVVVIEAPKNEVFVKEPKKVEEPKLQKSIVKNTVQAEKSKVPTLPIARPVIVKKPIVVAKMPPAQTNVIAKPAPQKIIPEVREVKPFTGISDKEIKNLITRFSFSYEEGEIDEFMSLFSRNVKTNNDERIGSIRKDYRSLFRGTDMREIKLTNLTWDKDQNSATGEGDFVVTVLRRDADQIQRFVGSISLELLKVEGKLKISGMYHAYGDDDN